MELRQLRYFVAVAHHCHFTRAADELRVAQPAVSHQVRALEAELGVALLARTTRRVHLTAAGEAFLPHAREVLAKLDDARRAVDALHALDRGGITVGTMHSLAGVEVGTLLAAYQRRRPEVKVTLREATSGQMLEMLGQGSLDLAFVQRPSRLPRGIAAEVLAEEHYVLVAPPGHRLAGRRWVELQTLRDEAFVTLERGSGVEGTLRLAAQELGFRPRIAVETGGLETVRELVAEGLGLALLPESYARTRGPAVSVVALRPRPPVRRVAIAWRRSAPGDADVQEFIAASRDAFAR